MKYTTISTVLSLFVIVIVFAVYASTVSDANLENFSDSEKIKFYSRPKMQGTKYELSMREQVHRIPQHQIGRFRSVEIPELYALLIFNDLNVRFENTVKLTGKIEDLNRSLKAIPQWKGNIKSAAIIGENIKIYQQPNFKGEGFYLNSNGGLVINHGGPPNDQAAKNYVRTDIKSFIVPRGLQILVLVLDGKTNMLHRFPAGAYPNTTIEDVKGLHLIITTDRY